SLDDRHDLGRGESARRLISVGKSDSAGREDGSPSALLERKRRSPIPGLTRTGFSSRMRQLKSRHRSLLGDKSKSSVQRLYLSVFPEAEIGRTDTTFRSDRSSFRQNGGGAAHRPAAQMYEMPILGEAIAAGILAHRRDQNPMGEFNTTQAKRFE